MPTLLHIDRVQRHLREHFVCSVPEKKGCLALTFDDGPNPRNTPRLLELLASKGIVATFFVVGKRLDDHGEISRRAHLEGHEIANHSRSHLPLSLMPNALVRREIRSTEERIIELTSARPRFFRPPMGWFNRRILRILHELDYTPVIGSIHPEDSRRPTVETILSRVRPRLSDGAILIFHDGGWRSTVDRTPTLEAVDRLSDECLESGHRFVTMTELVKDTPWMPPQSGSAPRRPD